MTSLVAIAVDFRVAFLAVLRGVEEMSVDLLVVLLFTSMTFGCCDLARVLA